MICLSCVIVCIRTTRNKKFGITILTHAQVSWALSQSRSLALYGLVAREREPVMERGMKYLLVTLACLMMRASARGNS
jgi:hypothetical protein